MSFTTRHAAIALAVAGFVAVAPWRLFKTPLRHVPPPPAPQLGSRVLCNAYSGLPAAWGKNQKAGMARIDGGSFELGSLRGYAEERPLVKTQIHSFWIDRTEVSNAQFASFVKATAYVTEAERGGGSVVFVPPREGAQDIRPGSWWHLQPGADWRHPDGPDSNIDGRARDPVVDVTYSDALAYAQWLGHQLPTEAQWEFAAKAGRDNAHADRALRDAKGHPQANFWQGRFPLHNTAQDGYVGRAPVGCFPANPDGLYDMVGNVWEWTADPYRDGHLDLAAVAPASLAAVPHVIKGGSWLCADNYCARARSSSRQSEEAGLPAAHLGFRTVVTAAP